MFYKADHTIQLLLQTRTNEPRHDMFHAIRCGKMKNKNLSNP